MCRGPGAGTICEEELQFKGTIANELSKHDITDRSAGQVRAKGPMHSLTTQYNLAWKAGKQGLPSMTPAEKKIRKQNPRTVEQVGADRSEKDRSHLFR